ncbi:cyclin-dependent kinase inhibitor 1B-like isoform X1 [Frieseomelitta varia]|uniref:cyclin-dependent kinase inhibitor 1B-like isoform X1 n=2 Tax=Frieseomelitta varia TaxID=561572 RepID=UPI001CB67E17|nr:cyclin-dependent kinase inhibitor 1B-like isoform X1 [Frieseomelitta varia]
MDANQSDSGHQEQPRARLMMQNPNIDIQEGRRLRNARRRLFEDDDDDETVRNSGVEDNIANCIFEEARKNRENAKQRWNFDFEKEQPLPGRYEWVKLDEHGNEVYNPLETKDRVENLQTMQEDNDVTMEDHTGGTGE